MSEACNLPSQVHLKCVWAAAAKQLSQSNKLAAQGLFPSYNLAHGNAS